jgi:hypothetical protein
LGAEESGEDTKMDNFEITEQQAEVASKWWANQLRHPHNDMGIDDPMPNLLLGMLACESRPDDERIDKFQKRLKEELMVADWWDIRILDVDYNLDKNSVLSKVSQELDISEYAFPVKTTMWINKDGTVEVSNGYGASLECLLGHKND